LVHRDVKPANFVMGVDKSSSTINVIDFGLAKKFRDPRTTMHIPYQQDEQHRVGTSLFASIHTHNSIGRSTSYPTLPLLTFFFSL
jgi:casein kinase I family protein HRR25